MELEKSSTIQTTFRCTKKEKDFIHKAAKKRGMIIQDYILVCLDEELPLKSIPYSNKTAKRNFPMGARLPVNMRHRILDSQSFLSSGMRKIKIWEIILYCCVYNKKDGLKDS